MHNVFVSLPSARGIHPLTSWNVFDMRTIIETAGHRLHGSSLYRMPLDSARNELAAIFLSTTCDLNLLLDDDVQLTPGTGLLTMIEAIDAGGCDIVSAPCRMRSEGNLFNIIPITAPEVHGGVRVVECAWTGLGAVLLHRRVFEKLYAEAQEKDAKPACAACGHKDLQTYRSVVLPERTAAALFQSRVEPARRLFSEAPEKDNVYLLDDRAFSMRAIEAGFKVHGAIDVRTVHDGLVGCFSEELEKFDRARAREAATQKPGLLGADGQRLR
jgi:hypothetical protein